MPSSLQTRALIGVRSVLAAVLTVGAFTLNAQSPVNTIAPADIDRLTGRQWNGSLEYRDYTTNKQTSIRSTLLVTRLAANAGGAAAWEMQVGYNDEPNENSRETVRLAADGRTLRGERVMERAEQADGTLRVVTEQEGKDNGRPARFRFVYLIDASTVSIQKLVQYAANEAFFERHVYRWTR